MNITNKSLYEVDRELYSDLVRRLPETHFPYSCEKTEDRITHLKKDAKAGTIITERYSDLDKNGDPINEKCYIYEFPADDDPRVLPPRTRPSAKIVLETPEQVQKLFDYLAKRNKENQ